MHVYKDFDPPVLGGIERHVALSCRYQRDWAAVSALTCSRAWRSQRIVRDGTPVAEVGEWFRLQGAPFSPAFPWRLRRTEADVVVLHMPNPTAELAWLLAGHRSVLIARYHSDVIRQAGAMRLYNPFQQRFLQRVSLILPTSQPYLDTSPSLAPFREKCRVVPLGIVTEDFATPPDAAIRELHERYGATFVLFAGRHRYYKGLPFLIEAARAMRAPLVVAGDGPERARAMDVAASLGVPVHFPGSLDRDDLVAHLHACSVFVFPSVARSEAFGMSIMEAHACGKPVVATRLGTGVEFINEDGKTGLNVPPRDPDALAAAVNRLLADPDARAAMGAYARDRITRQFHARDIARQEFEYYQEAVACQPHNRT